MDKLQVISQIIFDGELMIQYLPAYKNLYLRTC